MKLYMIMIKDSFPHSLLLVPAFHENGWLCLNRSTGYCVFFDAVFLLHLFLVTVKVHIIQMYPADEDWWNPHNSNSLSCNLLTLIHLWIETNTPQIRTSSVRKKSDTGDLGNTLQRCLFWCLDIQTYLLIQHDSNTITKWVGLLYNYKQ